MFDFPASPSDGQTYSPPGGPAYVYKDPVWKRRGGANAAAVVVAASDDPPSSPINGNLWWESDAGETFIRYADGDSEQWVQIAGQSPGIPEAPVDAKQYGRKNAAWAEVVVPSQGVPEAPSDGKTYGRKNGAWIDITAELITGKYLLLTGGALTGDLTIAKAGPSFTVNKAASGQDNYLAGRTNALNRWVMDLGNADPESGGDAGSNFVLSRSNDAGASLGSALTITRSNGAAVFSGDLIVRGDNPYLVLHKTAAAQSPVVYGQMNGKSRWLLYMGDGATESGGNAGSNFSLGRCNDAGAWVEVALGFYRDSGVGITNRGLVFMTLSSAPSVLDYYNEGTFVPTIRFGGASVGVTYSQQVGWWTRVGRIVTVQGRVTISNKGSSVGGLSIGGLPFPATGYCPLTLGYFTGFASTSYAYLPLAQSGAAIDMYYSASGNGVNAMTNTHIFNVADIIFSGSYVCD